MPEAGTLNICSSLMFCSCWFMFFHFDVSFACKKIGSNDDFIAYITCNGRRLQVFICCV